MNNSVIILTALLCFFFITGSSCTKKSETTKDQTKNKIASYEVKLFGEAARRRDIQKEYLFRLQCGRNKNNEGFEDWEKDLTGFYANRHDPSYFNGGEKLLCEYTGVGKVLEAALIYAWDEKDDSLKTEAQKWVDFIIRSQDTDGYYGIYNKPPDPNDYSFLYSTWVIHDGAYIANALLRNYELFGDTASLNSARRFIDLVIGHWDQAPVKPGQLSPIGIVEVLFTLFDITGEEKYLDFAVNTPFDGRFIEMDPVSTWRQILYPMQAPSEDNPGARFKSKIHTYRFFEKCISQLEYFKHTKDSSLMVMTEYALAKMIDEEKPGMFISGATGRSEGWVEDQKGIGGIGEACAVVHQIWMMNEMVQLKNDLSYGDFMERMILNHMYAAQNSDPEDGRTRYFVPLSGKRTFHKGAHCCEGNTRRFWARFPELVCSAGDNQLSVILYTPATLTTEVNRTGLTLTQETDYPRNGEILISIDPVEKVEFSLKLRIPAWANDYTLLVNDDPVQARQVKGGVEISRIWKKGDRVVLNLPMDYRWIAGKLYYEGRAALMRGPQVFCISKDQNPWIEEIPISSLLIDPSSVTQIDPYGATAIRHGQAARVTGETKEGQVLEVILTDFPEINGEETYFTLFDPSMALQDELYRVVNFKRH